jgi:hypothetical protein
MADLTSGLTVTNVTGAVYRTSRLNLKDPNLKAIELTQLIQKLVSIGVYQSIEQAIKNEVPSGTFILIDDPETGELDFNVQIVPDYISERKPVEPWVPEEPTREEAGEIPSE